MSEKDHVQISDYLFLQNSHLFQIFPITEKYADRFIDNLKKRNPGESIKIKEYVFVNNNVKGFNSTLSIIFFFSSQNYHSVAQKLLEFE